ncbi:MAG: HD domain-containing phosphohydrolase [Motiliproteus sp.]
MIEHSLGQTILEVHNQLKQKLKRLSRVALAIYDPQSDTLKTFIHSSEGETPLAYYQSKLSDIPSLQAIAKSGKARVVRNLELLNNHPSHHTQQLLKAGYHSSYTEPLLFNQQLLGFLFFDSDKINYFRDHVIAHLSLYSKLLSTVVVMQLSSIRTLNGALVTAREFSRHRDEETANHLHRMSYYSRTIAMKIAAEHNWDDESVEYIFRFAPLHDIGKIAIADSILLKHGRLDPDERIIMKTHVAKGEEMAQLMIEEFGLKVIHHIDILTNIIACHHEHWDGSGYPRGLCGSDIPLEGRIVAVADVFDALTSERPYKKPWSIDAAFDYLQQHACSQFDPDCVSAALDSREQFIEIHDRYLDRPF